MGFLGNFWNCLKDLKPLVMFAGECTMALEPMQENAASSRVELGYTQLFCIARWPQRPSRHVTVFLGTVRGSMKEVKAHFMYDGYRGIALHATQGNQASSRGKGKVSWFFSSFFGNLRYILR